MTIRPAAMLLPTLLLPAAARAQDEATHPAELAGVWAHPDSLPGTAGMRWWVIRFDPDGGYRAVQVEAPTAGETHHGEPVTGRWAALTTGARGTLLCTRPDGAEQSRCNAYRVDRPPAALVWKGLTFTRADSAMLGRLGVATF